LPGAFKAKPRRCGRKANDLTFDACGPLFKALGVDLTEIEGIDVGTALVILAEIGVDVSRFPTEQHFASWLGVCPRVHESNKAQRKLACLVYRLLKYGREYVKQSMADYERRQPSRSRCRVRAHAAAAARRQASDRSDASADSAWRDEPG
jgi:transposase